LATWAMEGFEKMLLSKAKKIFDKINSRFDFVGADAR
jgi:hypothetical protein